MGENNYTTPDGFTGDIVEDLSNALEKAIWLIDDIQIRKIKTPYEMIARWENLINYARKNKGE